MVLVLALDTSTSDVVVGVVDLSGSIDVLAETRLGGPARHGEALTPAIRSVLRAADRPIDAVLVGIGPGPFTGLRIGMVTAAALGDAMGVPMHGVCSLDAVALGLAPISGTTLVATDARRKEVYWAAYDGRGRRRTGPHVQRPADVAALLPELGVARAVGAGAVLYADVLGLPAAEDGAPTAAGLVAAAREELLRRQPPAALVPLYLRRPDAVEPAARTPASPA